jgi:hypothetical protein
VGIVWNVRSCYRMIVTVKKMREDWLDGRPSNSNVEVEEKRWTTLWRTKVPSKIRVFLWRLAHHSLPTGTVLNHRKMASSPGCSLCSDATDNWRHSLLECTMARCVWALLDEVEDLLEHITINQCGSAKDWLFFSH